VSSIRSKVAAATLLVIVIGGVIAMAITDVTYRRLLDRLIVESVTVAEHSFEALADERVNDMQSALTQITRDPVLLEDFRRGDREALQAASWPRFEALRDELAISRWYYYEPGSEGRIFLRVYRGDEALSPDAFGDRSESRSLERARTQGELSSGLEVGTRALSLRVVTPWRDAQNKVVGYVGLAQRVEDYLRALSSQTGDEFAMFLDKDTLDRQEWAQLMKSLGQPDNWDDDPDVVLADSTLADEKLLERLPGSDQVGTTRTLGITNVGSETYAIGTFPVRDVEGAKVGFVYVARDVTDLTSLFRAAQLGLLLGFIALAVAMTLTVRGFLDRFVFHRLDAMVGDLEDLSLAVAAGDTDGLTRPVASQQDEIGRFEGFFSAFLALVATALRGAGRSNTGDEDSKKG